MSGVKQGLGGWGLLGWVSAVTREWPRGFPGGPEKHTAFRFPLRMPGK